MYTSAKGVFDILPEDPDPQGMWRSSYLWQFLEQTIREHTALYGYREIRTPLFETTDLFIRSIGNETDIVSKEMYTFLDKADRSLTLRPEGTAPVMRSFIEKHLAEQQPLHRLFYIGPMFRYERQQAGRYRQHHQFGVEAVGSASPYQDVETIDLLFSLLTRLGLRNLMLNINSLGRKEARHAYIEALKAFLNPKLSKLSSDSQHRFTANPLRILDSKELVDQQALEGAPTLAEFLSPESRAHFEHVLHLLTMRGIPYRLAPRLVRGLDYYNDTVFEITSEDLGAQNSLGGGGRYDGLLKQLEGPDLPAFGFGMGIERTLQVLLKQGAALPSPPVVSLLILPMGERALTQGFALTSRLRDAKISCELELSGRRLKTLLSHASAQKIPYVIVLGDQELDSGSVTLKNMHTGESELISLSDLERKVSPCII